MNSPIFYPNGQLSAYIEHLKTVYRNAITVESGRYFTTVNELTDQLPATRAFTLTAAVEVLDSLITPGIVSNKILVEEDKGAIIGGAYSYITGLPLAIARMYSYDIPGGIAVPIEMEYMKGRLLVNGLSAGDRLMLIDDTLATGGTIIALAKAAELANAQIVDIRVIVEKLGMGGRERIRDKLGIEVKSAIQISIDKTGKIEVM